MSVYSPNGVIGDVMPYPTCLLTLENVYFIVTCHGRRSTTLSTTYANVLTHAFRPMVDILSISRELGSHAEYGITSSKLEIIE